MKQKNRSIKIFIRSIFWIQYFYAGFILYSKVGVLPNIFINFARIIFPLTIFWLQIRFNKKEPWFYINQSMATSQLWFYILPVLASIVTVIITSLNFYVLLINFIQ